MGVNIKISPFEKGGIRGIILFLIVIIFLEIKQF